MKSLIPIAALALLGACSSPAPEASNATNEVVAAPTAPAAPETPEQAFADNSAAVDSFAIAAGKLAETKATSPAIKAFAKRVYDEHVQSTMRLKAAVSGLPGGGLVDASLSPQQNADLEALQKAEGPAFDTLFVSQQRALHEGSMKAMTDYATNGANEELKAFADYNSRRVRSRLDRVREL